MNKQTCIDFREDFSEVIKKLEEKYGMSIQLGNIRFTENSLSSKIEAFEKTENGEKPFDKAANAKAKWELKYSGLFEDLPEVVFGANIHLLNDEKGILIDYKSKSHKYPFIVKVGTKQYKVSIHQIKTVNGKSGKLPSGTSVIGAF